MLVAMTYPPTSATRRYTRSLRDITDRVLEDKSGFPLDVLLRDERDNGASFAEIAELIERMTDGVVVVSAGTVRNWWRQLPDEAA